METIYKFKKIKKSVSFKTKTICNLDLFNRKKIKVRI